MSYAQHEWSGWPGAYCTRCRNEDVGESASVCGDCVMRNSGDDLLTLCDYHKAWADALDACPPNQEKVDAFLAKYPNTGGPRA